MDAIEKNIHTLLVSIKRSDIYQEYKKQEKILNENPELAERVASSGRTISGSRTNAAGQSFQYGGTAFQGIGGASENSSGKRIS